MTIDAYLRRIGYDGPRSVSRESLRRLHSCHMMSVPFENLDIHIGREILLGEERFYEKIVEHNRGGFCYELNGLFAWLLREMGFDVTMLSARVFGNGKPGPEFDHMALLVKLDERWIADVGFGDSFLEPLSLDARTEELQYGYLYQVRQDGDMFTLYRRAGGQEDVPQYVFTLQPRSLHEFGPMCIHQQTSPKSHFKLNRICSLATVDGRVTLSNEKLIVRSNGVREERLLRANEYPVVLKQRFNIDLPA